MRRAATLLLLVFATGTAALAEKCANWCRKNPATWNVKCGWGKCSECQKFPDLVWTEGKQCPRWCEENPNPWEQKCWWLGGGCHDCAECSTRRTGGAKTGA